MAKSDGFSSRVEDPPQVEDPLVAAFAAALHDRGHGGAVVHISPSRALEFIQRHCKDWYTRLSSRPALLPEEEVRGVAGLLEALRDHALLQSVKWDGAPGNTTHFYLADEVVHLDDALRSALASSNTTSPLVIEVEGGRLADARGCIARARLILALTALQRRTGR